jgi:hypothetical protein
MSAWSRHHKQFTERRRRVQFSRNRQQSDGRLAGQEAPLSPFIRGGGGDDLQALQVAEGGTHETGIRHLDNQARSDVLRGQLAAPVTQEKGQ